MQKKSNNASLRALMAAGSFIGLVGGWTLLAQSGKPAGPLSQPATTALVKSTPAPSAASVQAAPVRITTTSRTSRTPVLRTGGS